MNFSLSSSLTFCCKVGHYFPENLHLVEHFQFRILKEKVTETLAQTS